MTTIARKLPFVVEVADDIRYKNNCCWLFVIIFRRMSYVLGCTVWAGKLPVWVHIGQWWTKESDGLFVVLKLNLYGNWLIYNFYQQGIGRDSRIAAIHWGLLTPVLVVLLMSTLVREV